jgi:Na+/H+ antiporter NhaD/arsenite permease-like protein
MFPPIAIAPFAAMLVAIAVLPLAAPRLWERRAVQALVAAVLGAPTVVWVLAKDPHLVWATAHEYASFLVLLGSLFTISGGLVLHGDLRARPEVNTTFLAVGALLASVIGTTGASMVLIRPLLRTNSQRRHTRHLPVFFIVLVSNVGGMLTPLGDPPLFLGYLQGIPFFWTLRLAPIWALSVAALLCLFYLFDVRAYGRETSEDLKLDHAAHEPIRLHGKRNVLLLAGVVGCALAPTPWREIGMIVCALLSLRVTPAAMRRENGFSWGPIAEVAILFAGIFATMIPALEILRAEAPAFGLTEPWQFYWATGGLSSVLDNAPTYLAFLSVAQGLGEAGPHAVAGVPEPLLVAISAGAVMMGANTYIGNGPNFMVKAIAHESGIPTPGFFGYMLWSLGLCFPLYLAITFLFLT